ncbi:MAG: hypothetical protein MUQ56_07905 [Thermoleophilia bacterium]|nr:hypothetical protein [Thermoleophilia bacterium]
MSEISSLLPLSPGPAYALTSRVNEPRERVKGYPGPIVGGGSVFPGPIVSGGLVGWVVVGRFVVAVDVRVVGRLVVTVAFLTVVTVAFFVVVVGFTVVVVVGAEVVVDNDVVPAGTVVVTRAVVPVVETANVVVVGSAVPPLNATAAAVPRAATRTAAKTATMMIRVRLLRRGGPPPRMSAALGMPGYGSAGAAGAGA